MTAVLSWIFPLLDCLHSEGGAFALFSGDDGPPVLVVLVILARDQRCQPERCSNKLGYQVIVDRIDLNLGV